MKAKTRQSFMGGSSDGRADTQLSVHSRSTMPFLKASDHHKIISK